MSKSNQTLKDAIAEAKTLRETALANAKAALEEAFTPQLQSMLAAKLNELEEDKSEEEKMSEEAMEETLDLEALLAEDSVEEAKKEGEDEKAGEEAGEEAPEEEAGEEKAGEEEEDKDITEMTPEEVEEYIRKIAAEEFDKLEAEQGEEVSGSEGEDLGIDTEAPADEEEINLDEMLDETEDNDEDDKMEENDINIDELLAEFGLSEEKEEEEEGMYETKDKDADDKAKMEEELAQALATIDELRSSLQETNLLNAKLLYMNKVFKGHNLTESQKVVVVKTFDKAESAKEAKLVFESLTATLAKKEEKSPIKENLGFASKASGIMEVKANKVIDADPQISRWEKLAGIK